MMYPCVPWHRKLSRILAPVLGSLLTMAVAGAQPHSAENEVQLLRAKIRDAPLDASAWKNYGLALLRGNSPQGAASALATSCRLAPDEIDACYLSGRVLLSLDRYEEAAAALEQSLQGASASRPASAHRLAALSAIGLHEPQRAETHFQRAVTLWRGPDDGSDPRIDYAGLLYRSGRLAPAEEMLLAAIKQAPASPSALALLGRVRIHLAAPEGALQPLRDAIALAPCEWDYRLLLGRALLAAGNVEEGTEQMRLGREGWESTAPGPGPSDRNAPAPNAAPCPAAK
ncbi:MAG: tetratricopeptide repeat protein [Bryobacterales bacterium]